MVFGLYRINKDTFYDYFIHFQTIMALITINDVFTKNFKRNPFF